MANAEKDRAKVRTFKCTDETWAVIKANAAKYAKGNVSNWLRYAGCDYLTPPELTKPKKRD